MPRPRPKSPLAPCKHCGAPISKNADRCPQCGGTRTSLTRILLALAIVLGALGFLVLINLRPMAEKARKIERMHQQQNGY